MFLEHLFAYKHGRGTTVYQRLLLALGLAVLTACAPDAWQLQAVRLLGDLAHAQRTLAANPSASAAACDDTRAVNDRLRGEPGLTTLGEGWVALRRSADALLAACGQLRMLGIPAAETPATRQAQERWREGLSRELALACSSLRAAAAALGSQQPACS